MWLQERGHISWWASDNYSFAVKAAYHGRSPACRFSSHRTRLWIWDWHHVSDWGKDLLHWFWPDFQNPSGHKIVLGRWDQGVSWWELRSLQLTSESGCFLYCPYDTNFIEFVLTLGWSILQANGLSLLLELLQHHVSPDIEAQHAALNAAVSLRRLCDGKHTANAFCKARGLHIVIARLKENSPLDREPLRLPAPLGPSTIRLECKYLLGKIAHVIQLREMLW